MSTNNITSNRYSTTSMVCPVLEETCSGPCEGMGIYPVEKENLNAIAVKAKKHRLTVVGQIDKNGSPMKEDEFVFVICQDCNGTGKQNAKNKKKGSYEEFTSSA